MKRMMKRSLAFVTVIAMLLSLLATPVFAEEESNILSAACEHCQDVLFEQPDEDGVSVGLNEDGEEVCKSTNVPASCLDAVGYTKYECLVEGCGKVWTGNYTTVRADGTNGHEYVTTETEATCEAAGHIKVECKFCGDVARDEDLEQLTHTVYDENTNKTGSLVLDLEASHAEACKENSVTVYACVWCDYVETVEHEDTALEHEFYINTVASDRENGVTVVITCSLCNKSVTATLGNLTCDHVNDYVVLARGANCVDFAVEVTYCDTCDVAVANGFAAATNHRLEANAQLSYGKTCTEDGRAYKTCSVCYDANDVAGLWTKEDAAGNTGCEYEVIPAQGHWHTVEGEIVHFDTPICTDFNEEVTSLTCESCLVTYTKETTHDYETAEKAATCLTAGGIYNVCKHCGDEFVDNYVAPLGHNLVDVKTYDPKDHDDFIHAEEWAKVCDRGCGHVDSTWTVEAAKKLQFNADVKNMVKEDATVVNGGLIAYTVSLMGNNTGVEAFQFAVSYDAAKLSFAGYTVCDGTNAFGFTAVEGNTVPGAVFVLVENENRVGNALTDLVVENEEIVTIYFRVNAAYVDEFAMAAYEANIDLHVVEILNENGDDLANLVYDNATETVAVKALGDVNESGHILLADVQAMQTIILNKEYVSSADIDQDGDVDVADLAALQRYINKTDDYLTFIGA